VLSLDRHWPKRPSVCYKKSISLYYETFFLSILCSIFCASWINLSRNNQLYQHPHKLWRDICWLFLDKFFLSFPFVSFYCGTLILVHFWHHVVTYVIADVSEKCSASVIRFESIWSTLTLTLWVRLRVQGWDRTRLREIGRKEREMVHLQPWRERHCVSPKRPG
jgi:hypothetical protein